MKKRKVALFMAMLMCMSVTPAYAAVEETQELNTAETAEATVYADIDSVYTVTLPKTIKLDSAGKSSDYSVTVKGDIAGTDMVNVIPDSSFAMSTDGKDSVTANVTQTQTSFGYTELSANDGNGTTITGSVAAPGLTAGSWNGTFNFNVEMKTKPGLYKADGSMVTWQKLLDDGTINVQGGELTSGYTGSANTSASALTGTLVIDDSVTSLGENALANCENLTGIVIPDSVTTMKNYALKNTGITELTIPASVTTLEDNAAVMMQNLKTLTVNCSGETFSTSCIQSVGGIDNVIFNGSYKNLGTIGAVSIKYIKLPKDLENMPSFTSSSIETIVLQSKIKTLQSFSDAKSLRSIDLSHAEITEIPSSCFSGCTSLTDVKLPDTLQAIRDYSFSDCTALTLTVPDTVTTIGTNAFYNVKQVTYNGSAEDTAGDNWGALSRN